MSDEAVIQQLRHVIDRLKIQLAAARAEVSKLQADNADLLQEVWDAKAIINDDTTLISQLRAQLAMTQEELSAAQVLTKRYRDQVLARADTAQAIRTKALNSLADYLLAYRIKDLGEDLIYWALGPQPVDYGAQDWTVTRDGQRAEDWLPFEVNWSNSRSPGYTIPHTFFPAWLYKDYNHDPPAPVNLLPSGIAENCLRGTRPIHWSYTARSSWANFSARFYHLILDLVGLSNDCRAMKLPTNETTTRKQGGKVPPRRRRSI